MMRQQKSWRYYYVDAAAAAAARKERKQDGKTDQLSNYPSFPPSHFDRVALGCNMENF